MTNDEATELAVAAKGPPVTPEPTPRLIISLCGGGTCPTIYTTDRGTLLVQGNAVAATTLPDGELIVEIPRELLIEAARRLDEPDA